MKIALWILGALAGVVLAAGVTYAASSLSTQRIGLSSEPVNAGPRARAAGDRHAHPHRHADPEAEEEEAAPEAHRHPAGRRRPPSRPRCRPSTTTAEAATTPEAAAAAATIPRTIDWKRRRPSAMISVHPTEILSL